MSGDIGSWILGRKRPKSKVMKQVAKIGDNMGKQSVVSRTIQAGQGILNVCEAVNKVNDLAENLNEVIPKAGNLAQSMEKSIPTVQLISRSFCDSTRLLAHFSLAMTAMSTGANIIQTYHGNQALELIAAKLQDISTTLSAQTALMAQKEFPGYVYKMIRERPGQTMDDQFCDHWFFLYHPDDDWYPEFYHLLEQSPMEPRFCGYTNQLDTIFVFMMMARRRQREKEYHARERSRPIRPVKLHLLIPAYSPILIAELLRIPDEIGDFVIEGRINNLKEFVWFNLPEEQRHYVVGVGQWAPPAETWWEKMTWSLGLSRKEPFSYERRTLGRMQQVEEAPALEVERIPCSKNDAGILAVVDSVTDNKTRRRHATPVHQRCKRQHGKRRPIDEATKA